MTHFKHKRKKEKKNGEISFRPLHRKSIKQYYLNSVFGYSLCRKSGQGSHCGLVGLPCNWGTTKEGHQGPPSPSLPSAAVIGTSCLTGVPTWPAMLPLGALCAGDQFSCLEAPVFCNGDLCVRSGREGGICFLVLRMPWLYIIRTCGGRCCQWHFWEITQGSAPRCPPEAWENYEARLSSIPGKEVEFHCFALLFPPQKSCAEE